MRLPAKKPELPLTPAPLPKERGVFKQFLSEGERNKAYLTPQTANASIFDSLQLAFNMRVTTASALVQTLPISPYDGDSCPSRER